MQSRFEIDDKGWRQIQAGRPLWQLVKELVSNVWDERDNGATYCDVTINTYGHGVLEVIVEDDGPGFSDIKDAYTLMAFTKKRTDANKRGRFNMGEKELIAISEDATIETVGNTISFPKEGGRKVRKNDRTRGTKVTLHVKGTKPEVQTTMEMLQSFIVPAGIEYIFHSNYVDIPPLPTRRLVATTEATLKTQISDSPSEPLRESTRKTTVNIYSNPDIDEGRVEGAIYELGVYIQDIDMPYDVDVQQVVPMGVNRDTVSRAYLRDIYAEVLNVTAGRITEETVSDSWVQYALEDERVTSSTIKTVGTVQIGENGILSVPFREQENEDAYMSGMNLISPKSMSSIVRGKFRDEGILQTTVEKFGRLTNAPVFSHITPDMKRVADYARFLHQVAFDKPCTVQFLDNVCNKNADYNSTDNVIRFYVKQLGNLWFSMENGPTLAQTDLIVHEFAHNNAGDRPHSGEYYHAMSRLAAMIIHATREGKVWEPSY